MRKLDAPILRTAEVAAFGQHLATQFSPVHAERITRFVANLLVGLGRCLHVGANAAVVQQVHRGQQDGAQQLGGRQFFGLDLQHGARLIAQADGLGAARINAAAPGEQAAIVVVPTGTRQGEQPLAFDEGLGGVGCRVDEDVSVVESQHQPDMRREQHAIAKHVTRHVANAGHAELAGLCIQAKRAEVALHRLPGAARRDAHLLVVVTHRSAGGECVAEPEAVVSRNAVGDVREGRRALVGRHHQIGVVLVMAHQLRRWHDGTAHHVVGQVKQTAQEQAVAAYAFGQIRFAFASRGRLLEHKAAFGADRNDNGVLDLLRLHQAEDFGAEIFAPVGPAQAAARNLAATQMHTFDTGRIDPDFEQRFRFGHAGHLARFHLE